MNKNILIFGGLIILIIIIAVVFSGGASGNLIIENVPADAVIYIDGVEEERVAEDFPRLSLGIDDGEREVIVALDGHWPWLEAISVGGKDTPSLRPFMTPINQTGILLSRQEAIYGDVNAGFDRIVLPSKENKLKSSNGNSAVWVDGGKIEIEWVSEEKPPRYFCYGEECQPVITTLDLLGKIKNLSFYRDRDDVLIFSMGTGVFVVEADPFGNQNFQPVYEGRDPEFMPKDGAIIYIRDKDEIREYNI